LETKTWTQIFERKRESSEDAAAGIVSRYDKVNAIAFSPNDLYVAYAFVDGIVEVLNAVDNIEAPIEVSKEERTWIKSGQWDLRYQFIKDDRDRYSEDKREQLANKFALNARVIAFSSDDDLLACGFNDGIIKIWKMINGEESGFIEAHESPISALAFSPDNKFLASRASKGEESVTNPPLHIWNTDSWTVEQVIQSQGGRALIFSPDGNYFIFGSGNRVVQYRVSDWELIGPLAVPLIFVAQMAFSLDGHYLALVDLGGDLLVCKDYRYELLFQTPDYHFLGEVFFSPDGNYLAVCVKEGIYFNRLVAFSLGQHTYGRGKSEAYKIYSKYLNLVVKKYNAQYPQEKIGGNDQLEFLIWKALTQNNNQANNFLEKILKNAPLNEGSIPSGEILIEAADLLKKSEKILLTKSEKKIGFARRYMTAILGGLAAVVLIHQINARIRGNSKKTTLTDAFAFMATIAALRKVYKYIVEEDDYYRWKRAADSDRGGYLIGLANEFNTFAQRFYAEQMAAKRAGEKRMIVREAPRVILP
jgi:hypothetical protein